MNRSFIIVILPPIAVVIGWFWLFHWLGLPLKPLPFIIAVVSITAVVLFYFYQRRKSSRGGR